MTNCYLCGASPATNPLNLKDTFTAHSMAKFPISDKLCNRCAWVLLLRLKYYNPNTKKEVLLFSRNWSWLLSSNENYPTINEDRVTDLPTRSMIRRWLIDPPIPPFTIAIAESGQKHILPWSLPAYSREYFPVLFELDILYIHRKNFIGYLNDYEYLLGLGLTKTEINTGQYKAQNLFKVFSDKKFEDIEKTLATLRGSRLFELIGYVSGLMAPQSE